MGWLHAFLVSIGPYLGTKSVDCESRSAPNGDDRSSTLRSGLVVAVHTLSLETHITATWGGMGEWLSDGVDGWRKGGGREGGGSGVPPSQKPCVNSYGRNGRTCI